MYIFIYLMEYLKFSLIANMIPFYQGKEKASLCSFFNRYSDIGFIEVVSRDLHYDWGFLCQLLRTQNDRQFLTQKEIERKQQLTQSHRIGQG